MVDLHNGQSTSFWDDNWAQCGSMAAAYPSLFSHCTRRNVSVREIVTQGLRRTLVSRLTSTATRELEEVMEIVNAIALDQQEDTSTAPSWVIAAVIASVLPPSTEQRWQTSDQLVRSINMCGTITRHLGSSSSPGF